MIWGQTGTRKGATRLQLASVGWLWSRYPIERLHDGDAIGVDEQLYHLAQAFGVKITLHPPKINKYRAFCGMIDAGIANGVTLLPQKPYHDRDRDVVDSSQVMVGCPRWAIDEASWLTAKGGTWYTINYALSVDKPLAIVWPNGHITYRNWNLVKL